MRMKERPIFTSSARGRARPGHAAAAISVIALAGTLAACSAAGPGGRADTGPGNGTTAGGTLNLGLVGSTNDQVFPYASQDTVGESAIWQNVYDNLTYIDTAGKLEMGLATSFDSNAGKTVWTVHLRQGVKLHNGGTFDADDVIYSVKEMFASAKTFGAITQISSFVDPGQVTKVNKYTVRFKLKEADGIFPNAWSYHSLVMLGSDSTAQKPDGTGPFTVTSFQPDREAELTRFNGYWGKKPGFTNLDIFFFSDQQAIVNALEGGQVDVANAVPFSDVSALKSDGINFLRSDSATHVSLDMRTDIPPFNDSRVREAMELIINRPQVVQTTYDGYGKVGNDYDAGSSCPAPDVPQVSQNLQKAKQLLAAAGQPHLSVDLVTDGAFQGMTETAQLLSQEAAQIGVTVTVKKVDTATLLNKWLQWPFVVNVVTVDYLSDVPDHLLPDGQDNASHWNDPKFVSLADKLLNSTGQQQQCRLITQMQQFEHADSPSIVAAYPTDLTPYDSRVHGLQADMFGRSSFTFGGVTVG